MFLHGTSISVVANFSYIFTGADFSYCCGVGSCGVRLVFDLPICFDVFHLATQRSDWISLSQVHIIQNITFILNVWLVLKFNPMLTMSQPAFVCFFVYVFLVMSLNLGYIYIFFLCGEMWVALFQTIYYLFW